MLFAPFPEEGNPFALVVDPYWILVSIVQFLILYWLLRRLLWGPVTRTLDDRAHRIREGLDLAETAKQERERMKHEVEQLSVDATAILEVLKNPPCRLFRKATLAGACDDDRNDGHALLLAGG